MIQAGRIFYTSELFFWQGTASEATLVALLAARNKAFHKLHQQFPEMCDDDIRGHVTKLVCYCSDQVRA